MSDLTEKVPCVECGKPVVVKFAQMKEGQCLQCSLKRNPFYLLYDKLIKRVHGPAGSFDALSENEKLYYTLSLFRNEINNGGFHQFFFNSSGSYYDLVERGLEMMDEQASLQLLRKAKGIVFPAAPVPRDTETRRDLMPIADPDDAQPMWARRLDELDQRFYANPDTLTPKLKAFARERGLVQDEK